jgi:hypothetical protein
VSLDNEMPEERVLNVPEFYQIDGDTRPPLGRTLEGVLSEEKPDGHRAGTAAPVTPGQGDRGSDRLGVIRNRLVRPQIFEKKLPFSKRSTLSLGE